ncbi:MAG: BREX-1 system adenine-specific DNA-methyltransferase PglX [Acidobacteria bacterium]|nr:BREX-1 system adenine-specific DNA-methyltransferase PglX [Acidobacteriota bacterium]MCI0724957.1 BREX-1 system adenine-specific DNA-methyltransferase PglX [Acidobacteriota bacterium]
MSSKRVDLKKILADSDLRRKLMVSTIQATQAREGIQTTAAQASRAYYVVTEGEKTAFLDLERFKPSKGIGDRRHEVFVQTLLGSAHQVRVDVARRDFAAIDGAPLDFRGIGAVAHIFREVSALEPGWGIARQGKATGDDPRWVRQWWEVVPETGWVPFAKGGEYCRFYSSVDLVLDWRPEKRGALKESGNGLPSEELYFRQGLTWPRRTQRGFNLRVLPGGCVFADKGPSIFPNKDSDSFYLLGVANSAPAEYLLRGLMSFGSWEVGVIRRLPIPAPPIEQKEQVGRIARTIYELKAKWDRGNETSVGFNEPWLLIEEYARRTSISAALDSLVGDEAAQDRQIQELYTDLNDHAYKLYGIPTDVRKEIEHAMGDRPAEIVWAQMEGKTRDQKRMEHVWRLLSYVVKRVVEADEDGIVPFLHVSGETPLLDRVHAEFAKLFPGRDVNEVEVEIVNELKRKVNGYRRVESIREWLENVYFTYQASLYKERPIFWHIASKQGKSRAAFAALVHYHRFDKDQLAKLRGIYLREALGVFRREAALAAQEGRAEDRLEWQGKVEEAEELDRRLQRVQEGFLQGAEDYRILTPWKTERERPKGWDPDINDGVKINIEPLQRVGVLRIPEVV